eukprot:1373476-Karenia_brevis.AAC.1
MACVHASPEHSDAIPESDVNSPKSVNESLAHDDRCASNSVVHAVLGEECCYGGKPQVGCAPGQNHLASSFNPLFQPAMVQ